LRLIGALRVPGANRATPLISHLACIAEAMEVIRSKETAASEG